MIMSGRTTTAGGSEAGITMSERLRRHIANWIPEAASTIDEDDDYDTYATTSTFSPIDAETDDTAMAYRGAQTTPPTPRTNVGHGIEHGRTEEEPDGPDPDIVKHLIQHWRTSAKSKFDDGEYAAAEKCLQKVVTKSEAAFGGQTEWGDETLQLLVLALSRQGKWNETHLLLLQKFEGREETMEQIATRCREECNWEQAEKILLDLWNHPAEPRDHNARSQRSMRLKHAFAEVYFGKKDYANAEKWCHRAVREIRTNLGIKDPFFYESIYLLANVYNANGDPEEAEAYRSLLPPEFVGMTP
jgi:tetratricopeptide (TPR) repeat protein